MDSAYGLKKGCKREHKISLVLKYKGGSYLSIPDNYHITVSYWDMKMRVGRL